jgi:hypothetical protein
VRFVSNEPLKRLNPELEDQCDKAILTAACRKATLAANLMGIPVKQIRFVYIFLAALTLLGIGAAAGCHASEMIHVNIFGDGNPDNGVEDSRQQLFGGRDPSLGISGQPLNAGTIHCDGKLRGSAMAVDTRPFREDLQGIVIVSAAHVLFNLESKRRFRRCEFHFLGLGNLDQYRARIDPRASRLGNFDPQEAVDSPGFGAGDWVFLYLRKPWKAFRPDQLVPLADYSLLFGEAFKNGAGEVRLVAWNDRAGVMSVSRDCQVFESLDDDLGGGHWKGQLLDDCDSGGGASGGGIVAVINGQQFVVGIRSGSHWSDELFPYEQFPQGPQPGSLWGRDTNTNFARAIDAAILSELTNFLFEIAEKEQRF